LRDVDEGKHSLHLALDHGGDAGEWLSGTAAGWWHLIAGSPFTGAINAAPANASSSLVIVRKLLKKFKMAAVAVTDGVWHCEQRGAKVNVLASQFV